MILGFFMESFFYLDRIFYICIRNKHSKSYYNKYGKKKDIKKKVRGKANEG